MDSQSQAQLLHQANDHLRSQLLTLSEQLSAFLSPHNPPTHQIRDKTISNTHHLLSTYQSQLALLLKRQSRFSPTRITDLNHECSQLESELNTKLTSVRLLLKGQKQYERKLITQSEDLDYFRPVDVLKETIKNRKEEISRLELELNRGEEVNSQVKNRYLQAEKKFNKLLELGAFDPEYSGPPVIPPDDNSEVTLIRSHFTELSKSKAQFLSQQRKKTQTMQVQLESLQCELGKLQEELKEKVQETRIFKLQISDWERQLSRIGKKNAVLESSLEPSSQTT